MINSFVIRYAVEADIPVLVDMYERYAHARKQIPLTFDKDNTRLILSNAICDKRHIFLIEENEGIISGVIHGVVDRGYYVEMSAYILVMYVEKEFHGLGVPVILLRAFENEAKRLGASICFGASLAGMGDRTESLFVKLLERCGYSVLGRTLIRSM